MIGCLSASSLIGTWLQSAAQQWVVLQMTNSEAALGVTVALSTLPILLFGLWAGPWVERIDRRKLLIGTQTAAMILAVVFAILLVTNVIQLWHIYVLSFALGIVSALDFPAQQAFLGDLAGMSEVRKAVNLNAMIVNISRMLGPAFAGTIIARLGVAPAFWLNALSFLAVIATLVLVRSQQVKHAPSGKSALHEFIEGLKYLYAQPRLKDLAVFALLVTFLGFSILTIASAFVVKILHGDAETYGLLLSASGAGALTGVLFIVPIAQAAKHTGRILIGTITWMGLWMLVTASTNVTAVATLSFFMTSIGAPTVITIVLGLVQVLAPQAMRARMLTVFIMISFGMQPIASFLIGLSAQTFSIPTAIAINGGLFLACATAMFLLRPELRHWSANQHVASVSLESDLETAQKISAAVESMEI